MHTKYKCKNCDSTEFQTQKFHTYRVFEAEENKLVFMNNEYDYATEYKEFLLFCRNCNERIDFEIEDIKY